MKTILWRAFTIVLLLCVSTADVSLIVNFARPVRSFQVIDGCPKIRNGIDFLLRLDECRVLREGIDPFKIWHGDVTHDRFKPLDDPNSTPSETVRWVNAYTPWTYALMMPLSCLPDFVAWPIWYGLMVLSFSFIGVFAFARGVSWRQEWSDGVLATACVWMIHLAIYLDFQSGNFPLVLSAALVGMVVALERRKDWLAGLCWAVIMVKPQIGVLFAIPLLIKRKFRVCLVASVACVALAIVPAVMCRTSLFTLILEAPAASVHAFSGCGLMPGYMVRLFGASCINLLLALGAAEGVVCCCVCTWLLRRSCDWTILLMPAAVVSTLWTYAQFHNFAIAWLGLLICARLASRASGWPSVVVSLICAFALARGIVYVGKGLDVCLHIAGVEHGLPILDCAYDASGLAMIAALFALTLMVRRPDGEKARA